MIHLHLEEMADMARNSFKYRLEGVNTLPRIQKVQEDQNETEVEDIAETVSM